MHKEKNAASLDPFSYINLIVLYIIIKTVLLYNRNIVVFKIIRERKIDFFGNGKYFLR